jgi:hypothetical protein
MLQHVEAGNCAEDLRNGCVAGDSLHNPSMGIS